MNHGLARWLCELHFDKLFSMKKKANRYKYLIYVYNQSYVWIPAITKVFFSSEKSILKFETDTKKIEISESYRVAWIFFCRKMIVWLHTIYKMETIYLGELNVTYCLMHEWCVPSFKGNFGIFEVYTELASFGMDWCPLSLQREFGASCKTVYKIQMDWSELNWIPCAHIHTHTMHCSMLFHSASRLSIVICHNERYSYTRLTCQCNLRKIFKICTFACLLWHVVFLICRRVVFMFHDLLHDSNSMRLWNESVLIPSYADPVITHN